MKYSFDDDPNVIAEVDKAAKAEGTDRAAFIRRAIRRELRVTARRAPLFLPAVSENGDNPEMESAAA